MDMEAITIRMPKKMIDKLDEMVEDGLYPNKSEAIREAARNAIRAQFGMIKKDIDWRIPRELKREAARELLEEKGLADKYDF